VISGGAYADKVADELKRRDVAVVFSLKLPDEPKEPKHHPDYDLVERPKKLLDEEKREYEERLDAPLALSKKRVRLCFSTAGVGPEKAWGGLKKLLERKFPPDAALRALTTDAAEILGASGQLGSIEVGKIANLVLFTKPLGEKSARARFAIVDGVKIDLQEEPKGGKPEINLTGSWKARIGSDDVALELKQKGPDVSGTLKLKSGDVELKGTVGGKTFRLKGGAVRIQGEMDEDQLIGSIEGAGADGEFAASRPKKE
jgi:hypothetical protein